MPVNVRYLSDNTAAVVQEVEGGEVVPVTRDGQVIGVMVRTDPSDLYGERGWGSEALVPMRDFTRLSMSQFTDRVARGAAVAVSRRNVPVLVMLPVEEALTEGLLVGGSLVAGGAPGEVGRALTAEEIASGD